MRILFEIALFAVIVISLWKVFCMIEASYSKKKATKKINK